MSEDLEGFDPTRPPSPTIEPLDDEATAFLEEAREVARALALPEGIDDISAIFASRRQQWFAMAEQDRPDPNDFITAVGVVVAERIAQTLNLDWVMYTDEDGTALALIVEAGRVTEDQNLYIFPLDGIASRWPEGEEGEVADYYAGVTAYVQDQLR